MSARDEVSNIGVGWLVETFKIDDSTITYDATQEGGSAAVGKGVTLSGNDTVALVGDGEKVEGMLLHVESDGVAAVVTEGVVELPGGAGASLTRGKKIVGDLGPSSAKGYIREVATATAAELGVARGSIRNTADTAAVVVKL
jgi:hypothetical protein